MKRLVASLACLVLLGAATGCTRPDERPVEVTPNPAPSPTEQGSPSGSVAPSSTVSLPSLFDKEYDGGRLRLGKEVEHTATQRQYDITYRGDGLTISGRIAVPEGPGPFPAVVLAHGFIDPGDYTTGQGMTREREWFADHGYVALHVDYRGYGSSDGRGIPGADLGIGYATDVINAVLALRAWDGPVDDDRVALVGRSLGGGVVLDALVADPGLTDAAVVWAPVSSDLGDLYRHFLAGDPGRADLRDGIDLLYGSPRDNPDFWRGISPRTYFDRVTEPVLINHGTADETCPLRWSRETARLLHEAGDRATLAVYPGEGHSFGARFDSSMERSERFLADQLR
ncbi:alpha/beta hydrolase family protein [Nocardioides sp. MH1]|uniref:alpha/beta hydrolase family protein n=1 Tax=Nocardioides sp. MH1 TaxID=3242490 RepID=UPI0035205B5B